jgi:hypothetical protein
MVEVRWYRKAGKQAARLVVLTMGAWCCKQYRSGLAHVAWPWQRMQVGV